MYCKECGAEVNDKAVVCIKCGCSISNNNNNYGCGSNSDDLVAQSYSPKPGLVVLLLALFIGALGIHSFYVGRTGVGIGQLLTAGGCGIWVLIDIIMLILGTYKDSEGRLVHL